MITFEGVTLSYEGQAPIVSGLDLEVCEGEWLLLAGPTGSGKSTLLKAVNGLMPRLTGGTLEGRVAVNGRSTVEHGPEAFADLVGYVGQDPTSSFVAERVEDELAYVMENLAFSPATMRRRVEEVLDLLDLHRLRHRPLATLSLGERQRVAIGAALTAAPEVLVLDEPTSALDPLAAEEVLAAVSRLVHDLGITVLVAEHRLERALPFADRVAVLDPSTASLRVDLTPAARLGAHLEPPLAELGRRLRWPRVPLTVREGRRASVEVRASLEGVQPRERGHLPGAVVASLHGVHLSYGEQQALSGVDLELWSGEVVAIMGRNGAGKSSALAVLSGLRQPVAGSALVLGVDPAAMAPTERIASVGLVPQNHRALLYASSVAEECATADTEHGLEPGATAAVLERLLPGVEQGRHPLDLSEGQRLILALAVVLAPRPKLVLLDEPTRGLDYEAKRHLAELLGELRRGGSSVLLATHDVELVAQIADRTVVLAEGEVVAVGDSREVLAQSPASTTQVGRVFYPAPWLTVDEVVEALEAQQR